MKKLFILIFMFVFQFLNPCSSNSNVSQNNQTKILTACGNWHSVAIKDCSVWTWGANWYGQLGNGTTLENDVPIRIEGLNDVISVSCGSLYSLALKRDGTVWTWGYNYSGQLGSIYEEEYMVTPVKIENLTDIVSIACGDSHSLVLEGDGTVWAWGNNYYGQLGNNALEGTALPTKVQDLKNVKAISAGKNFSIALKEDGSVWYWGSTTYVLRNNINEFTPIPMKIDGLDRIIAIACGDSHSLALKEDGTVWAWGENGNGQLGTGNVQKVEKPIQVCGLENTTSIACGSSHSIALKADGTVWAWGGESYLGNGTKSAETKPIQVKELIDICSISAKYNHNLAVKRDSTIWAWGNNWKGQIGDGTTLDKSIPVRCLLGTSQKGINIEKAIKNDEDSSRSVNTIIKSQPKIDSYENHSLPKDDAFSQQWGLLNQGQLILGQPCKKGIDINVQPSWNMTMGSDDVIVGVLDTGIDINHIDLKDNIFHNPNEIPNNGIDDDQDGYIDDINGWDFANNDSIVYDSRIDDAHGTVVAGIIAARDNNKGIVGVAPRVKIMPLKFMNGNNGLISDLIKAIEYAKMMNIKIVNCSWGWKDSKFKYVLENVMKDSDILFVCAAGNKKSDESPFDFYPASLQLPNIISVASVNSQGVLDPCSNYGSKISLAAPGVGILCTVPENKYIISSGSSVAAPFVSGVAALLKSYNSSISTVEMANKIVKNVQTSIDLKGKVNSSGIVDAYNTLK